MDDLESRRLIPGDERQRDEEIREQIAETMFAALLELDREIRKVMGDDYSFDETDSWSEDADG